MEFKNTEIYGLRQSLIRSGYPMQVGDVREMGNYGHSVSQEERNLNRSKKLGKVRTGTGHDNFLKGIIVQFDMKYPEYFSPQLQRYHWIDIISSQSKMHKITSRELTKGDFTEFVSPSAIDYVNELINRYKHAINVDDKDDANALFKAIVQNLPLGYMKWMGISTNYLQLKTIYLQRRKHKLNEWREFCGWCESLPMFKELIGK